LNGIINNLLIYLDFPHKFNGLPPLEDINIFSIYGFSRSRGSLPTHTHFICLFALLHI